MSRSAPRTVRAKMAERRARILDAARDLIAERGLDGLTMRALAEASRVTVPTLYNLIGGRDQVVMEAVRDRTARFVAGIQSSPEASPGEEVLSVVDSCCAELLHQPGYYKPLLAWILSPGGAVAVQHEVGEALRRELRTAIEHQAERGGLVAWIDRDALARALAGHLGANSLRWSAGELDDQDLLASAHFDVGLALIGLTSGEARERLEHSVRRAQSELEPRARRTPSTEREEA